MLLDLATKPVDEKAASDFLGGRSSLSVTGLRSKDNSDVPASTVRGEGKAAA